MDVQKVCIKCNRLLYINAFYHDINYRNGKKFRRNVCKKCRITNRAEYEKECRKKVIEYYSGGKNSCYCCGEFRFEFLTIEHDNGTGAAHRKIIGNVKIGNWLIKNNYPAGFSVLCWNCNAARGIIGYCPHEKEKQLDITRKAVN